MTWCYHQPRVVSLCRFTPIPFNIPVKQVSDDYDDEQLVSTEFNIVSLFYDNHIGGVMISVLSSSAIGRGVKPKTIKCVSCFSAKHAALRRKSKDWMAWYQDNMSE